MLPASPINSPISGYRTMLPLTIPIESDLFPSQKRPKILSQKKYVDPTKIFNAPLDLKKCESVTAIPKRPFGQNEKVLKSRAFLKLNEKKNPKRKIFTSEDFSKFVKMFTDNEANIIEKNKYLSNRIKESNPRHQLRNEPNMAKVMSSLNLKLRNFYSDKKNFITIFNNIDLNNMNFLKIIELVSCYKIEMGQRLTEIYSTFQNLIRQLLIECYMVDLESKRKIEENAQSTKQTMVISEQEKTDINNKMHKLIKNIKVKDSVIRCLKMDENILREENQKLKKIMYVESKPEAPDEFDNTGVSNKKSNIVMLQQENYALYNNIEELQVELNRQLCHL